MLPNKCSITLTRNYDNLSDYVTVQKPTICFCIADLFIIIVTVITFCMAVCFSVNSLVSMTEVNLCLSCLVTTR